MKYNTILLTMILSNMLTPQIAASIFTNRVRVLTENQSIKQDNLARLYTIADLVNKNQRLAAINREIARIERSPHNQSNQAIWADLRIEKQTLESAINNITTQLEQPEQPSSCCTIS